MLKCPALLSSIVLCLSLFTSSMGLAAPKKQVLILNSYNTGYAWTDNEMAGIRAVFAQRDDVVLRVEYMDTKLINDEQHYHMLADIYARKYRELQFDAIITTDDDALKFMRQFRDQLFPNVPLVFAGVNNYQKHKTRGLSNFTGINETADFAGNLRIISQLLPQVRQIVVINDDLTTGMALAKEFKAAAQGLQARFQFEYLTALPVQELKQHLAQLQPHQAVFYLSFFRDGNGVPFAPHEILPALSAASSVPMFGAVDYMLGKGIVGGSLKSALNQGKHAGELANQILSGIASDTLPVRMESPQAYMFDYQQLQRFGISLQSLPSNSSIINEPQGFYHQYKMWIWLGVLLFCVLLAYIMVLLVNIKQRIRAQHGLQGILETSNTLFDIHSHQQFKHNLVSHLERILPDARDIFLLRYKGKNGCSFNEDELAVVGASDSSVTETVKHLAAHAISHQRCVYHRNEAVALFDNEHSPVNLLYVNRKHKLDKTDQQLLELFAGNVSMSINNAETYKLSASLQTAQRIQNAMLPTNFAPVACEFQLDLHAFVVPAKEVGGDLYDFFALDADHLCLLVGDVSDKGVPAAIFMAMAKTVLRSVADISLSPAEILYQANNELSRDNDESMFVTLLLMIFNRQTGMLRYANGGHNPAYLQRVDGHLQTLPADNGIALGVMEGMDYLDAEIQLQSGDSVLLYSDGVTEATNTQAELFGEARLVHCIQQYPASSAQALNSHLLSAIQQFVGDAPQADDITSLCMRYQPLR